MRAWVSIISCLLLFFTAPTFGQKTKSNSYWLCIIDTITDKHGYKNQKGDTVIPLGKYIYCFTDTFRTYAIVAKQNQGLVAINKQQNVLYKVFTFDNGPDYISDGLFRIQKNNKIGYADAQTGKVMVAPTFACALPFENGRAKVSNSCSTHLDGEHDFWTSDHWFYIDKHGHKMVSKAQRNYNKKNGI